MKNLITFDEFLNENQELNEYKDYSKAEQDIVLYVNDYMKKHNIKGNMYSNGSESQRGLEDTYNSAFNFVRKEDAKKIAPELNNILKKHKVTIGKEWMQ